MLKEWQTKLTNNIPLLWIQIETSYTENMETLLILKSFLDLFVLYFFSFVCMLFFLSVCLSVLFSFSLSFCLSFFFESGSWTTNFRSPWDLICVCDCVWVLHKWADGPSWAIFLSGLSKTDPLSKRRWPKHLGIPQRTRTQITVCNDLTTKGNNCVCAVKGNNFTAHRCSTV